MPRRDGCYVLGVAFAQIADRTIRRSHTATRRPHARAMNHESQTKHTVYGAAPIEGSGDGATTRARESKSSTWRRALLLLVVALIASVAALGSRSLARRALGSDDVSSDPTPEPLAVTETKIEKVVPSDVKLSADVATAACSCSDSILAIVATTIDTVPTSCAAVKAMDKSCFAANACSALKSTVNNLCPGTVP